MDLCVTSALSAPAAHSLITHVWNFRCFSFLIRAADHCGRRFCADHADYVRGSNTIYYDNRSGTRSTDGYQCVTCAAEQEHRDENAKARRCKRGLVGAVVAVVICTLFYKYNTLRLLREAHIIATIFFGVLILSFFIGRSSVSQFTQLRPLNFGKSDRDSLVFRPHEKRGGGYRRRRPRSRSYRARSINHGRPYAVKAQLNHPLRILQHSCQQLLLVRKRRLCDSSTDHDGCYVMM